MITKEEIKDVVRPVAKERIKQFRSNEDKIAVDFDKEIVEEYELKLDWTSKIDGRKYSSIGIQEDKEGIITVIFWYKH